MMMIVALRAGKPVVSDRADDDVGGCLAATLARGTRTAVAATVDRAGRGSKSYEREYEDADDTEGAPHDFSLLLWGICLSRSMVAPTLLWDLLIFGPAAEVHAQK